MPPKERDPDQPNPKRGAKKAVRKVAKKLPPRDPENETFADASMVNALESDPDFFKDPLIGTQLGKCKMGKLIGEGKTSVVYRADYLPLKRTVAVKVLQDHMAKMPAVLRVFQREGRAVAALDHENILKIYDVGEDQGKYFLVLELLRGKELAEIIAAGENKRVAPAQALEFTRQAARGLQAAHRKNLIHRDIKPQNLVVEPDGMLKIVDFGLATEAEGAFAGGRLGTPHFMAPEQCRGELAVTATDIYALGITLFHMVVGHAPYKGEKTTDDIIARHLEGKPLEPEKFVPELPGAVSELIRRMTRMNPNQRPTADEVVETIDRLLKGSGKGKARTSGGARRGAARRGSTAASGSNSTAMIGIAGTVVVLIAVLFFLMSGDKDEPEPEKIAVKPVVKVADKPKKEPAKPKEEPKATGDEALDELMKSAKGEERTGNLREALDLYKRVMQKTGGDKENPYYKEAAGAVKEVRKAIKAAKGGTGKGRITLRMSEDAAREFDEKLPEFRKLLTSFQVQIVIDQIEKLQARMRKDSPALTRVEAVMQDVNILNDLLGIVQGRAQSLGGGKEKWMLYDMTGDPDEIVMGADTRGVELRNTANSATRILAWSQMPRDAAISLLDALRAPTSATDAFRLGYYCHVIGDDRADLYFDMAIRSDSTLGADVKRVKKATWEPEKPKESDSGG